MRPDDLYDPPSPPPPNSLRPHHTQDDAGSPSHVSLSSRANLAGPLDNSSSIADDTSMTLDDQQSDFADSRDTLFAYYNDFIDDEGARNEDEPEEEDEGQNSDEDMSDDDGGVPLSLMSTVDYYGISPHDLLPEDAGMEVSGVSGMANLGLLQDGAAPEPPLEADAAFPPALPFNTFLNMEEFHTVPTYPEVLHQPDAEHLAGAFGDDVGGFDGNHPIALSNPNPNTLGPENPGLFDFLRHWAWQSRCLQGLARERGRYPWLPQVNLQAAERVPFIRVTDLEGDRCDFQGIDWAKLGVTRREARERRRLTYKNYVNKPGSDRWQVRVQPWKHRLVRKQRLTDSSAYGRCHPPYRELLQVSAHGYQT